MALNDSFYIGVYELLCVW